MREGSTSSPTAHPGEKESLEQSILQHSHSYQMTTLADADLLVDTVEREELVCNRGWTG
jgi:hypothetical protein